MLGECAVFHAFGYAVSVSTGVFEDVVADEASFDVVVACIDVFVCVFC